MMESNLSFQAYKNHIKFMEKNDNSNSSIHRSSTSSRTSSSMATPILKNKHDDIRSTTHPTGICGVSNTNNLNFPRKGFTHFHAFNIHDVLKKLRGRTARSRSQSIKDTLLQVHRPWHKRGCSE